MCPIPGRGRRSWRSPADQVDCCIVPVAVANPQRSRCAMLAVASAQRFPLVPDLPTLMEAGLPVVADAWIGLLAAPGTPPAIAEALDAAVAAVLGGGFRPKRCGPTASARWAMARPASPNTWARSARAGARWCGRRISPSRARRGRGVGASKVQERAKGRRGRRLSGGEGWRVPAWRGSIPHCNRTQANPCHRSTPPASCRTLTNSGRSAPTRPACTGRPIRRRTWKAAAG